MKQIILFIVFIFTIMMCSFAQEAPSSPIIKGRDNKSTEFFKNKKLQSTDLPQMDPFSVRKSQGLFILKEEKRY
mgnify:CR=1 FL=1